MVFTKINYGKSVTKNLGDFNSVKIEFSAEIEVDEDMKVADQVASLKESESLCLRRRKW